MKTKKNKNVSKVITQNKKPRRMKPIHAPGKPVYKKPVRHKKPTKNLIRAKKFLTKFKNKKIPLTRFKTPELQQAYHIKREKKFLNRKREIRRLEKKKAKFKLRIASLNKRIKEIKGSKKKEKFLPKNKRLYTYIRASFLIIDKKGTPLMGSFRNARVYNGQVNLKNALEGISFYSALNYYRPNLLSGEWEIVGGLTYYLYSKTNRLRVVYRETEITLKDYELLDI